MSEPTCNIGINWRLDAGCDISRAQAELALTVGLDPFGGRE
jgi:hypothetical protein